mgnify:CR=1 FL=1
MSDPKPRAKRAPKSAVATTETVLVTRYVRADMTAYGGFRWPESGPVEATDWKATKQCGNGLHGWSGGKGDASAWSRKDGDKMLVVEVAKAEIIDLEGKVKFPRCVVLYCGDAAGMSAFMGARGYTAGLIGGVATAGPGGVLVFRWYQVSRDRWRVTIATIGEDGIAPGVKYRVDENGSVVPA